VTVINNHHIKTATFYTIFCSDGTWRTLDGEGSVSLESAWWKDLKKVCGKQQESNWFNSNIHWKIGRGNEVKLWENVWLAGEPLNNVFPRLYTIYGTRRKQ